MWSDLHTVFSKFSGACYKLALVSHDRKKMLHDTNSDKRKKRFNIHLNGNFEFLASCHRIEFSEFYSTSILVMLYCFPKTLVQCAVSGGRGYSTNFYTGRFCPEVQPLYNYPIYTILAGMIPLSAEPPLIGIPPGGAVGHFLMI